MNVADGDVAVIGGGAMGAMTLWRLACRGVRAVCFEQFSPGHDRGASGGETRIFRTAYKEEPRYVPLLREAYQLWRSLERESGRTLLELNGALMVGEAGSPEMANVLASLVEHGVRHERLSPDEMTARYPQHRPLSEDTVVLDLEAGFLRPDIALVAAAAEAERRGAVVERYARVEAVVAERGAVTVRADGRSRRFRAAVVAPGPWVATLLPRLAPVLQVKRPLQAWFAARHPEWFAPGVSPVFMRVAEGCYALPSVDGVAVKLGLSNEWHRVVEDPDRFDRTVSAEEMRRLHSVVARVLPDLYPDPIRLAAYMEAYTPDGHALLGPMPGASSIVLMCGFSGHGFKLAPLFGDVAAELVLEGRTPRAIEHLAPDRFPQPWR
jgi:sarcosine oxidase